MRSNFVCKVNSSKGQLSSISPTYWRTSIALKHHKLSSLVDHTTFLKCSFVIVSSTPPPRCPLGYNPPSWVILIAPTHPTCIYLATTVTNYAFYFDKTIVKWILPWRVYGFKRLISSLYVWVIFGSLTI